MLLLLLISLPFLICALVWCAAAITFGADRADARRLILAQGLVFGLLLGAFLFSMALLAYNCRQVVYAALRTAHAVAEVEAMSDQAVALEIEQAMDGLVTALPEREWDRIVPATLEARVAFLTDQHRSDCERCRFDSYVVDRLLAIERGASIVHRRDIARSA